MLPAMLHEPRLKMAARLTLAILMTLMGVGHFLEPAEFAAMVPAWLPAPHALVFVSGLAEVVMAPVARAAAYGLILLYIAVFPANINMAVHHISPLGTHVSPALLWARLPFQFLFIAWAWWLSRPSPASPSKAPAP
jgi:uncharacterized membrane protein